MGLELALGYRLFLMRQHLSVETVDQMIQAMNNPAIVKEIVRHGDMDRPAKIAGVLMKNPSLLRFFSPLLLFRDPVIFIKNITLIQSILMFIEVHSPRRKPCIDSLENQG